ncbi:MAG: hypothetical protein ACLQUY_01200 [Ktedonobacterales bacterium]
MTNIQTSVWSGRYAAASARLGDTAHLVETWERIQALLQKPEPSTDFFAGQAEVAGAGRVGLFAGTFNPLTLAHAALVEAAKTSGSIDCVLWILAVASVDKESVVRATLVDRLVQLVAYVTAVSSGGVVVVNRGLYVDEVDIIRTHVSAGTELVVLVGFDKIVQILDPHYYADPIRSLAELFSRARFLVAPRDKASSADIQALLSTPKNSAYSSRVSVLPLSSQYREDSATVARELAAEPNVAAEDLSGLLPPEGVALALETGAYSMVTDTVPDKYRWRSAWITALGSARLKEEATLPGMERLLQATMDPGERGRKVRSALQSSLANPAESRDLSSVLGGI